MVDISDETRKKQLDLRAEQAENKAKRLETLADPDERQEHAAYTSWWIEDRNVLSEYSADRRDQVARGAKLIIQIYQGLDGTEPELHQDADPDPIEAADTIAHNESDGLPHPDKARVGEGISVGKRALLETFSLYRRDGPR